MIEVTNFKPIGKRILVLPMEEEYEKTAGGIIKYTSGTYDSLNQVVKAKVVEVSNKIDKEDIAVGDIVHYQKKFELSQVVNNVRHVVLNEEHIIVVEKTQNV